MANIRAKKVILKNRDGEHLVPITDVDALNYKNITNCLLEVPQRIKYDLTDGTLTIKAGSVVIVPYGVEDLTAQYPVGAKFLNDNFKVYDTQYEDGKFFVWAELVGDLTISPEGRPADSTDVVYLDTNQINLVIAANGVSGATQPTSTVMWYDTTNNIVAKVNRGVLNENKNSLPILLVRNGSDGTITSIEQVFNGMGYIGSTVWVDKGAKGLIPNGRNEDGTLKNIEFKVPTLVVGSRVLTEKSVAVWYESNNKIVFSNGWKYVEATNGVTATADGVTTKPYCQIATVDMQSGVLSNFQPKQPFHAPDIQDVVRKTGDTMSGRLTIDTSDAYSIALITPTDYNTAPTVNTYNSIRFLDNNGLNIGGIQYCHRTTGVRDLSLIINDGANTYNALKIGVDANGTFTANAPTPATGDNSTKIATTAFVKNTAPPVGSVITFGSNSSTPTGYLYCNGAAVSRTTYAALFKVIGTEHGTGDGSTTFNLPNYTGNKFVTSTNVAVFGDGKSLGLNNGSVNIGLGNAGSGVGTYANKKYFHVNRGTNNYETYTTDGAMGVSTSSSTSGLKGTVSAVAFKWYIKY